ncbi:hypothetical protein BDZ90DRAFT_271228 [Jaminaea rosea]|uniref:Nucleoporin Pom152 n=1 Tax=Jaminaea rosea TaxID=1569628 RepID=A0A316USY2_9BASI|nr:hypothetical protein BDZ90DRAFT_271228 [Jaminaea rosea]PWN28104.1 hypothetical protein BDZ90DRAFT_271228 [Jaminaea rosea]
MVVAGGLQAAAPPTSSSSSSSSSSAAAATTSASKVPPTRAAAQPPLIPTSVVDAPTQRLWAASLTAAIQAYKLYSFFSPDASLSHALLVDLALVLALSRLRIPRLDFIDAKWAIIGALLAAFDWLALGGWHTLLSFAGLGAVTSWIAAVWDDAFSRPMGLSEHRVRISDLIRPSSHILGEHTIHILPHSTASISSRAPTCHCIGVGKSRVEIPIFFNNTDPTFLQYSVTPFGSENAYPTLYNVTISKGSLTTVESARDMLQGGVKQAIQDGHWDEVEAEVMGSGSVVQRQGQHVPARAGQRSRKAKDSNMHPRQSSQQKFDLSVSAIGRVRLERVMDKSRMDARIAPGEVIIVQCPTTSFAPSLDGQEAGSSPLALVKNNAEDVLSALLGRRHGSTPGAGFRSFDWALPQHEKVPIFARLDRTGSYSWELDHVRDACGNEVSMSSIGKAQFSKEIQVHERAHATIVGCSRERPLQLLRNGTAKEVLLRAANVETDAKWTASVRFEPEDDSTDAWTKNVTIGNDGLGRIQAAKPGNYILEQIDGSYCSGEVGSPWSCPVIEVPPPTADISFSTIEDVCAGSVGVNAMAVLSGSPPFRLQYEIKRSGQPAFRQERVIERTREEFEFRPSTEGAVQYRFIGLSDANYRGLPLDGPTFEQVVHPLASASFVKPTSSSASRREDSKIIMRSCEGNRAKAEVQLEGTGPFDLTYALRTANSGSSVGSSSSHQAAAIQHTVKGITRQRHTLDIELPPAINAHGGSMTISLVSIRDGKNCERSLTTSDVNVEIRRVHPTAAFVVPGSKAAQRTAVLQGESLILEGQEAKLPLRLEGEGPWKVEYRREGDAVPVTTTLHSPEAEIVVDRPGVFQLVSVHDAYCQGSVVQQSSRWNVEVRRRPVVAFDAASAASVGGQGRSSKQQQLSSLIRPPVCRGVPDSANLLLLSGQAPVQVTYEHEAPAASSSSSPTGRRKRETFSTAQNITSLHLSTSVPGWHRYRLVEVGDSSYALGAISRSDSDDLVLEQLVHPLPSARFIDQDHHSSEQQHRRGGRSGPNKRKSFCLGDTLSGRDMARAAPIVQLSGSPPFDLEFELRGIQMHNVALDLNEAESIGEAGDKPFRLDSTGTWVYRIVSLVDGNGCSSTPSPGEDSSSSGSSSASSPPSLSINVAETANLASVGARDDYCVGERIQYVLQGTAPWTVVYSFEGKVSTATNLKTSTSFSRIAEKPGVLEIKSVAHASADADADSVGGGGGSCRKEITNPATESGMRKTIHALPRVRIMDGGHSYQDVRQGTLATILFSLSGEPPFDFTYQHLEATDRHSDPKVLETRTVVGVNAREYRLQTREQGTWRVTWLKDRWCSVSIDGETGDVKRGSGRSVKAKKMAVRGDVKGTIGKGEGVEAGGAFEIEME